MPYPLERIGDGSTADTNFKALARDMNPPVPQARVYNSANISITTATVTALTFDTEYWDEGSLHSTSSNTGRLTAPITGLYEIGAAIAWAANATGVRFLALRVNGTTGICANTTQAPAATDNGRNSVSTIYRLAAGDYVEALAYQTSGGALNVITVHNSNDASPDFWMARLGGYVNVGV